MSDLIELLERGSGIGAALAGDSQWAKDIMVKAADALEAKEREISALRSNYETAQANWNLTLDRAEAAERALEEKSKEWQAAQGMADQNYKLLMEARREIARLEAGLAALVNCRSPLTRAQMREGANDILRGRAGSWPDQSPFLVRAEAAESQLATARRDALEEAERKVLGLEVYDREDTSLSDIARHGYNKAVTDSVQAIRALQSSPLLPPAAGASAQPKQGERRHPDSLLEELVEVYGDAVIDGEGYVTKHNLEWHLKRHDLQLVDERDVQHPLPVAGDAVWNGAVEASAKLIEPAPDVLDEELAEFELDRRELGKRIRSLKRPIPIAAGALDGPGSPSTYDLGIPQVAQAGCDTASENCVAFREIADGLKPFAELASRYESHDGQHDYANDFVAFGGRAGEHLSDLKSTKWSNEITVGDLRAARSAYELAKAQISPPPSTPVLDTGEK